MLSPQLTLSSLVEEVTRTERLVKEIHSFCLTPSLLASLRENARCESVYYGCYLSGTRFTKQEMMSVLGDEEEYLMSEKEERLIRGYSSALDYIEELALTTSSLLTPEIVQKVHGLLSAKTLKARISPYRETDDAIRDLKSYSILYKPARAQDIAHLVEELILWVSHTLKEPFFCPFIAGILHHRIEAIRPFADGNRRLAQLLARFVLLRTGYDCKGMYALEGYYAQDLKQYYTALGIGSAYQASPNYTHWLRYFSQGMIVVLTSLKKQIESEKSKKSLLVAPARRLDAYQCKALGLFKHKNAVTAYEIKDLFRLKTHTARALCLQWTQGGFFEFHESSKKKRSYKLGNFNVSL